MGSLSTQKMLATAPQIARATLGRATALAHPNAPSRALYGPGVARPHPQPQKRSTCVLPTRSKASWDSFARKRCSQRQHLLDNARNSRGRTRTARPSKCVISCVTRARSAGEPTHTTAETPRARALNTQRRITGSLCTQTVCARNMRHLKTLGRATNLSSIKTHHVERHTGREWRIHPHMHIKHSACLLWPRSNASLDPFALKTCSQYTAPPRARASLGRASNLSLIKMQHIERYTGPE